MPPVTIFWYKDNKSIILDFQKEKLLFWKLILGVTFISLFVFPKITSWKKGIWSVNVVSFHTLDLWLQSANTHVEWQVLYFRSNWNLMIKQLKIFIFKDYTLVWILDNTLIWIINWFGFWFFVVVVIFNLIDWRGVVCFVLSFFAGKCYIATCQSHGPSWRLINKSIVSCIFS